MAKYNIEFGIPAGADGADGLTPHIGHNGNWFIGETDTEISAKGATGAHGLTPQIGNNGNWFIGESDTGKSSVPSITATVTVLPAGSAPTVTVTEA